MNNNNYGIYVSAKIRKTILGGKIALKLLRIAGDWAKAQNAEELHVHSTAGIAPERTDRLLSKFGFKAYGGNYVGKVG